MNITEKSKEYAEGKALNAISTAIEEAYAEGYRTGYLAGYGARGKALPIEMECGVSYVDLELPSGTMWSSDFLRDKNGCILYFTYDEAAKFNIPTIDQFKELCNYCDIFKKETYKHKSSIILGKNGKSIKLDQNAIYRGDVGSLQESFTIWLKGECKNNKHHYSRKGINSVIDIEFMGCRMPIMVVRY